MKTYDVLIVGTGLSGATIAEPYARDGKTVLLIDKRNHIGGNIYDEVDKITGIRVSRYGAHLFHTNNDKVWNYIQQFGEWKRWDHTVIADVSGTYVPIPVNITTVNTLLDQDIQTEYEMKQWLSNECSTIQMPSNSEEIALQRVGPRLYETLFKNYTIKQWAKEPKELDPSVLSRIPVRHNHDPRYFSDRYQALPVHGYTSIIQAMLSHPSITVQLNTTWEAIQERDIRWSTVIFTGPIDQYFKSAGLPQLEYRSINFTWETLKNSGYYQPNSVVNYPSASIPYTRSVEYKHFLHQKSDWTILSKETTCDSGEPYYPIPTKENQELYEKYKFLASKETNVHFIGRLASYKYFNMDQAIENAIEYYNKFLQL
jgi:UDP-galactopyranose mutase